MKNIFTIAFMAVALTALSYGQGVVDDFDISPTTDLQGHFKWVRLTGQTPSTASWGVNASTAAYPYNPGGAGNQGAIVYDSLLNASASVGLRVSAVIAGLPSTNNFKNVLFGFVTTKDSGTLAGYGAHIQKNTTTDVLRIRRINAANSVQLFDEFQPSGITLVPAANLSREWLVGDTLEYIYYPDGRKTFGIRTPGGPWDTVSTVDVTTSLASGFYLAIWGLQSASPVQLDHLTINLIGSEGGGGTTDTQGPTISTQSLYPSNWTATTTGSITTRITDNYGIDSIIIRFRAAGGSFGDSLKLRCGTTADTTVVWNITAAKAVGNYEWYVYARDDTGNTTTGTTQLFTVSGSHQWESFIASIPVWSLNGSNTGGNAPGFDVRTLNYSKIGIVEWFPGINMSSQTGPNYWTVHYSVPHTGQDLYIHTNGTGTDYMQMVRDSLNKYGGKFILDLGGAGTTPDANMTFICQDSTRAQTFCDSAANYAYLSGFDGVALNWEFPGTTDRDNLSRWIRIMRRKLDAWPVRGTLMMWVSGRYNEFGTPYDATVFNANVDIVMPMTYGYGQGGIVEHNTMLYEACGYPCPGGGCSVDNGGPKSYLAQGFDTATMAMTTTFENIWITQTSISLCGTRTGNPLYTSYQNTMQKLVQYPASYNWSDVMKVPYLVYTEGSQQTFVSYENPQSLVEKLKYGESLNLKYFCVWDITRGLLATPPSGHTTHELTYTIADYIGGDQDTTSVAVAPALVYPTNGATGIDKSNISVRWNTVTAATSYRVQVSLSSGFGTTIINTTTTDTSAVISSGLLDYSTTYYWRIASINSAGQGGYASAYSFRTASQTVTPPSTPTLVNPTANATGVTVPISFRWNFVTTDSLTGWDFQFGAGTDSSSLTLVQSITGLTDTQYVYTIPISYSTVHWWRVRAINPAGYSGWSAYRKFTTSSAPFLQTGKNQKFAIVDHSGRKYFTTLGYIDLTPRLPAEVFTPDSGTYAIFVSKLDNRMHVMDWNRAVDSAAITPHTHNGGDITSGLVPLERTAAGQNIASGTAYTIGGKQVFLKSPGAGLVPVPDSVRWTEMPYLTPGKIPVGSPTGGWTTKDSASSGMNNTDATPDSLKASIHLKDSSKIYIYGPTNTYIGALGVSSAGGLSLSTPSNSATASVSLSLGYDGSSIAGTARSGWTVTQYTLGERTMRLRTDVVGASDILEDIWKNRYTTTTATPAVAWQISLDSSYQSGDANYSDTATTYQITFNVIASRTNGAAGGAAYTFIASFRNEDHVVTQIGSTTMLVSQESDAALDASIGLSGDYVQVTVTGLAANFTWHIHTDIKYLSD